MRLKTFPLSHAALALTILTGTASAQVVGGRVLTPFFDAARDGRLDIGLIGDSNAVHHTVGWDHGMAFACAARFGLYATGVHSAAERIKIGYMCSTTTSDLMFARDTAPSCAAQFLSPLLKPGGYIYVAPGAPPVPNNKNEGLQIEATSPLDVNQALRFHYTYGTFDTESVGVFTPCVRIDVWPYTEFTPFVTIATGGGECGVQSAWLDIPAGIRNAPVAFRYARPKDLINPEIRGPFMGLTMRAERPDLTRGVACHTMYAQGGYSARDMAADIFAAPDETLAFFFSQMRALQPTGKRVVLRIDAGLNDLHETEPSIRQHILPGDSPLAYRDNVEALIERLTNVWRAQGWDAGSLAIVITVSHPIPTPEEEILMAYRDQADLIASQMSNVVAFRWDAVTSAEEMASNEWYFTPENGPTENSHLSTAGYEVLSERLLNALVDAACIADFNQDGGVDGSDIGAFFTAWEAGSAEADINADGGIDGADVSDFFTAWERGAC